MFKEIEMLIAPILSLHIVYMYQIIIINIYNFKKYRHGGTYL
jgi:hypothetical protein